MKTQNPFIVAGEILAMADLTYYKPGEVAIITFEDGLKYKAKCHFESKMDINSDMDVVSGVFFTPLAAILDLKLRLSGIWNLHLTEKEF